MKVIRHARLSQARQAIRPRLRFLPTAALPAIGIPLGFTLLAAARKLEDQCVEALFHTAAQQRLDALETEISMNLNALASLDAFYDASYEVERTEFARFIGVSCGFDTGC